MHWFLDPIKNHYADFSGRTTRKEFWMFALVWFLIGIAFNILGEVVSALEFVYFILVLAVFIPWITIVTRRLHDIGMSGWWQLLSLIPLVGFIIMIVLLIRPGDEGANQYGPNPNGSMSSGATETSQASATAFPPTASNEGAAQESQPPQQS